MKKLLGILVPAMLAILVLFALSVAKGFEPTGGAFYAVAGACGLLSFLSGYILRDTTWLMVIIQTGFAVFCGTQTLLNPVPFNACFALFDLAFVVAVATIFIALDLNLESERKKVGAVLAFQAFVVYGGTILIQLTVT